MTTLDLLNLRQRVSAYCRTCYCPDPDDQRNILLKEEHIGRVAATMGILASEVLINRTKIAIAEAIGLLHDVGRFPQYAHYRTFRDSISVNHGSMGADVIAHEKMLAGLPGHVQELILNAVRFHNALTIPAGLDPETIFFLKMVRDADKLDIWRIFAEYFGKDVAHRETAVGLDLPDIPGYSEEVLDCLSSRRPGTLSSLTCLNDFKIMQLTWVYDLNFPASVRLAGDQGHIDRIIATLPETSGMIKAVHQLKSFMREQSAGDRMY